MMRLPIRSSPCRSHLRISAARRYSGGRRRGVRGARATQDRRAGARAIETKGVQEPKGRRWPAPPRGWFGVASALAGLLLQAAEAADELGQVVGSRIRQGKPSAG